VSDPLSTSNNSRKCETSSTCSHNELLQIGHDHSLGLAYGDDSVAATKRNRKSDDFDPRPHHFIPNTMPATFVEIPYLADLEVMLLVLECHYEFFVRYDGNVDSNHVHRAILSVILVPADYGAGSQSIPSHPKKRCAKLRKQLIPDERALFARGRFLDIWSIRATKVVRLAVGAVQDLYPSSSSSWHSDSG